MKRSLCLVAAGGSCRLGGAAGIAERVTKLSFFFVVYTGFKVRVLYYELR